MATSIEAEIVEVRNPLTVSIQAAKCRIEADIMNQPAIPSNYGLITYNGAVLTVS